MGTINKGILESYSFAYNASTNPNPLSFKFSATNIADWSIRFENISEGGTANLVAPLEDSADGVTYADVSGGSATVVPGGTKGLTVNVRQYVRLKSTGSGGGTLIAIPKPPFELTRI